jgi:predicted dehydrogenase
MNRILLIILCLIGFSFTGIGQKTKTNNTAYPVRPKGQENVLELRCPPMDSVRIGIIGVGMRGIGAVSRFKFLEKVRLVAICDVREEFAKRAQDTLVKTNRPPAVLYTGLEDWKKVCERNDIDLIYICTPWDLHTPIAVYAMNHGKHVAIEVPAATTVEECWQLVNTSEKTRKHCMMLENCCYDFFEMTTLNLAQKGKLGTLVHGEGAYIHDLRTLLFDTTQNGYYDMWRLKYHTEHTGNPYATHGLGPIAQAFNIHRGDRMRYLVSVSSGEFGLTEYAKQKFGSNSKMAQTDYKLGDMSSTLIKTQNGKTILLQHNVTNPGPYSRLQIVYGTKGFAQKYPIEGYAFDPAGHEFLTNEKAEAIKSEYEHPIVTEIGKIAKEVNGNGHGGIDFIMDYRLIYCLRNGLPLDQDVYDAAEWSCIGELSEISAKNGGIPVEIPDFTRGDWNKLKSVNFYHK